MFNFFKHASDLGIILIYAAGFDCYDVKMHIKLLHNFINFTYICSAFDVVSCGVKIKRELCVCIMRKCVLFSVLWTFYLLVKICYEQTRCCLFILLRDMAKLQIKHAVN